MDRERIGHTGITWPSTPEGVAAAIADLAPLGYRGFETFGNQIDRYPDGVAGLRATLDRHGMALTAAYCAAPLIDPDTASDDVAKMVAWAGKVKELGGDFIVVGASNRKQASYSADEYRGMVYTLDEIGRQCLDIGITAAFHPHTGTPVETREEIDRVMGAVDPRLVAFAPDTGQIQKGGSDPVEVLRTYLPLVRYVHLKDYDGGPQETTPEGKEVDRTGYVNYVPIGAGVVDVPAIVRMLDDAGFDGWWMVELDRLDRSAVPPMLATPGEAAAVSKRYLDTLLEGGNHG